MPIRLRDQDTRLSRWIANLESVSGVMVGTTDVAAARTGIITGIMEPTSAALAGVFTQASGRTGVIASTTANVASAMQGTFTAASIPDKVGSISSTLTNATGVMLGTAAGTAPSILWSANFESGTMSEFNGAGLGGITVLNNGEAYSGSFHARASLANGSANDFGDYQDHGTPGVLSSQIRSGWLQLRSSFDTFTGGWPSSTQKIFIVQFYDVNWASGSYSNANRKYQIMVSIAGSGTAFPGQYIIELIQWDNQGAGTLVKSAFVSQTSTTLGPTFGSWDTLRLEWVLDTNGSGGLGSGNGNGVLRLWRNNTLIIQSTTANIVDGNANVGCGRLLLSSKATNTWLGTASAQYWDNIEVANGSSVLSSMPSTAQPRTTTSPGNLFTANFTTPGANVMYNFGGGYTSEHGEGTSWTKTHEATGGPGGTPCCNFTFLGPDQFNFGWWTPSLAHSFVVGDSIFLRFVRRWHNNMRWNGDPRIKLAIIGEGASRCIVYANYPNNSTGGALGWKIGGGGSTYYPHAVPPYFGLGGQGINNDWTNVSGIYGSTKVGKNITVDCAGPALCTYGNNPNPPVPGPNSAAPTPGNCWYYEQYEIRSGSASTHYFKIWVNNNDYNNPTVVQTVDVKTETVGVGIWQSNGAVVGHYVDTPPVVNSGFRISGCQIGTGFNSLWYPG